MLMQIQMQQRIILSSCRLRIGSHLQGRVCSGKLKPPITGMGKVPVVPMGKLTGLAMEMRGIAAIVTFAEPNSNSIAYPGKVTAREQEVQGSASTGTKAEMLVSLTTTQLESGSTADAF